MKDEITYSRATRLKVSAALALLSQIRPGIRANAVAAFLISILKKLAIREKVARANIALCFPEKTEDEREKILQESYENMIWTGVEVLAWQHDPSLIEKMAPNIDGIEKLHDALERGKGAIVTLPHISNWEFSACRVSLIRPMSVIVRHSDSPFQRLLIDTVRERGGLRTISKAASMKTVITCLRKNELVGIVGDQHAGNEGIPAPFFGEMTSTFTGAPVFSLLTGAPIVPFAIRRIEPFKFEMKALDALHTECTDKHEAIADLTAQLNRSYEEIIRFAPGQYLWQHKRFKEKFDK